MTEPPAVFTPPSIVVGIDGSRAAERAARWAVDEAVGRELPLHLLAACSGAETHRQAEAAIGSAVAAVAADGRPVTVTTDVITGHPAAVLQAVAQLGRHALTTLQDAERLGGQPLGRMHLITKVELLDGHL